jgi:FSR family fosmidomycin resistance protein-like MFS transporter
MGHFTNDLYGNLATSMAPYFVLGGRLSAPAAGALVLIYLAGSSVLQPIFGILSDRSGRRWFAVAGPAWIGCCMSALVVLPSAWMIFVAVAIGGIGTAAFHPQGASMVNKLAGAKRGWGMSIFSTGGNLGYGLGPLLAALLWQVHTKWSVIAVIPGLVCSSLLFRYAPTVRSTAMETTGKSLRDARANVGALTRIVLVIAIRSGAMSSVIFLSPLIFHDEGLPATWGSYGSTLFLLAGAAFGLYTGRLSDVIGRKPVVVWSLIIAAPLIFLVALAPGLWAWPIMAFAGMAIVASNAVTVVQAQELLPGNVGLAAGLTLGLGFGLSGVMTFVVSAMTKVATPRDTLLMVAVLPLVGAALAATTASRPAAIAMAA